MSEELSPPPSLHIPPLDATVAKHVAKWRELLGETTAEAPFLDANSIRNQLYHAVSQFVLFMGLAHARQIADSSRWQLPFSRHLHFGIDRWHFTSQLVAIRRLLDTANLWRQVPGDNADGKEHSNASCSVVALLTDLGIIQDRISRKQLFAIWGKCPDLCEVEAASRWYGSRSRITGEGKCEPIPLDADPERCEHLHAIADCVCTVQRKARSLDDKVNPAIIRQLRDQLDRHNWLCKGTKKFVTHPATRSSRATAGVTDFRYRDEDLLKAFEDCTRVVAFLEFILNRRSFSALPSGMLERATSGYFPKDSSLQRELESKITALVNRINRWTDDDPFEWLKGLAGGSESPAPPPP